MHPNPSFVLFVSSVVGILVAFALMMVGALWARVRSIPLEETARLVDDLARQQHTIEALLSRLEVDRELGPAAFLTAMKAAATAGSEVRPQGAQRADRAEASAVSGPTLIAVPSLSASAPDGSAAAAAELGRRFGAIWALADAGKTSEAIAQTTGQPIGQVELILGLRRQLVSQPGGRV